MPKTLFDDRFNELNKVGDMLVINGSHSRNQVACAIHNFNKSKSRNPSGKVLSYRKSGNAFNVFLVEVNRV